MGVPTVAVMRPSLPTAEALLPYLRRIDQTRIYSNYGPLWREFHGDLHEWLARRVHRLDFDLVFTSSGTTAIELALRARVPRAGGICLMPSFTFVASAHAVTNAGLQPHLLDIDPTSLGLTPQLVAEALPTLETRPAAVLVVSPLGSPVDLQAWEEFERVHGVPVVVDAAAAAMSITDVSTIPVCVSLHATKVLGVGEGGVVISSDRALCEAILSMTGFGFTASDRVSTRLGGNYRISEYTAAVGLAVLNGIAQREAHLLTLASEYGQRLADAELAVQDGVGDAWVSSTFNVILPRGRLSSTLTKMDSSGVQWRRWWGLGTHRQPAFTGVSRSELTHTEDLAVRVIGIPFFPGLEPHDIDKVVGCLM